MRDLLSYCLTVLVAAESGLCPVYARAGQEDSRRIVPGIFAAEPVFDFGSVDQGMVVRHVFKLENRGEAVLRIRRVRACCGGSAYAESRIVEAGGSTGIVVSYDCRGRIGKQRKTITVASNDPAVPFMQLVLEGIVTACMPEPEGAAGPLETERSEKPSGIGKPLNQDLAPLIYAPEPIFDFGKLERTNSIEHAFIVENRGNADLDIYNTYMQGGGGSVRVDARRLEPGGKTLVHVSFGTRWYSGIHRKRIIVVSNDPENMRFPLFIRVEIIADGTGPGVDTAGP